MPKGVYLHIPFCEHICYYCDFNKVFLHRQPVWGYLESLEAEMAETMKRHGNGKVETIFAGGGTPTALNEEQMAYFMESIGRHLMPRTGPVEFTMEANPGNLTREKLNIMKQGGINRLSLGVQSFNDRHLQAIGRTHSSRDVFETVALAREIGFDNISIDLMYRLPDQTVNDLDKTLQTAFSIGIDHVSIYSLQVEPRTIFYNRMRKGQLPLPTEDEEARMYDHIIEAMEKHGLFRYEISNFARTGFESKHNMIYWNNEEYYGLGAGAHGYVGGIRTVNAGPVKKYIRLIGEQGDALVETLGVNEQEQMEEHMFLGLRKSKGVQKSAFKHRFGVSVEDVFGEAVHRLVDRQLLRDEEDRIYLTKQGLFLGNEVFQAFI